MIVDRAILLRLIEVGLHQFRYQHLVHQQSELLQPQTLQPILHRLQHYFSHFELEQLQREIRSSASWHPVWGSRICYY